MNKVYLVWRTTYTSYSYDGTDEELVGVFSTEEEAKAYVGIFCKGEEVSISAWTLNKGV